MSPELLPQNSIANSIVQSDMNDSLLSESMFQMSSAIDLYHLMAGNLELIELYERVN